MKKPKNFKGGYGCSRVRLAEVPQFAQTAKPKGKFAKGLRYQAFVMEKLAHLVDVDVPEPWIKFEAKGDVRWAQPDWLGFDLFAGKIFVVEVKLTRTPEAWWQLNRLYLPLLKELFPKWVLVPVEVAANVALFSTPEPVRGIQKLQDARAGVTSFLHLPY
jgi:hypothetical protein